MNSKMAYCLLCILSYGCTDLGSGTPTTPDICSIGADSALTAGPTGNVGDTSGFSPISSCGVITGNVYLTANVLTSSGNCFTMGADNITLDGRGFSIKPGTGKSAIYVEGHSGVSIRNVETTAGITFFGGNTKNCILKNSTAAFIYILSGDGHTIRNNELGSFIADSSALDPATGITFSGNTLTSSSNNPVTFKGSTVHPCPTTNHLIENNFFTSSAPTAPTPPHGVHFYCSKGNTIRGNIFKATDGATPLLLSDEANSNLFEENTFWAAHYYATLFKTGDVDKTDPENNIFRNNIFRTDNSDIFLEEAIAGTNTFEKNVFWGSGIVKLSAGHGNTYDHNTFYSTTNSQVIQWDLDTSPADIFENNIVAGKGGDSFGFDTYNVQNLNSDYNLFFKTTGASSFESKGSLSGWQTASSSDGLAQDVHSVEGNPDFVSPSTGNFLITSNSAAIGKDTLGGDIGAFPASCTP